MAFHPTGRNRAEVEGPEFRVTTSYKEPSPPSAIPELMERVGASKHGLRLPFLVDGCHDHTLCWVKWDRRAHQWEFWCNGELLTVEEWAWPEHWYPAMVLMCHNAEWLLR